MLTVFLTNRLQTKQLCLSSVTDCSSERIMLLQARVLKSFYVMLNKLQSEDQLCAFCRTEVTKA